MADRTEYFRRYNKEYREKNREEVKARHSSWREENREKRNAYMRGWWARAKSKDPEKYAAQARRISLKRRYGITPEEYDALLATQGGHCALCERTPDQERYGYLNVDHCHDTGRVRGLLCTPHNHALGMLGDNKEGLQRAMKYMEGGV